jgi:undecaprenyl-diphosphatase
MTQWILRAGATDARLLMALARLRRPSVSRFMRLYTHLGDAPVPIAVALVLLVSGGLASPALGLHAFWSLVLAFGISHGLKRVISRPRPNLPEGLKSLVDPPDRFSFPSGHATASLAVMLPVALAAGGGGISLLVLAPALLVGVSRCYLGVHYPGDVLAGWLIAVVSVLAVGAGVGLLP